MKRIDLLGMRFGRLVVVKESPIRTSGRVHWDCLCDCGKTVTVASASLKNGLTKSCGCLHSEISSAKAKRLWDEGKWSTRQNFSNDAISDNAVLNEIYAGYKVGAKSRGYSFDIDGATFIDLTSKPCYYCGEQPKNTRIRGNGSIVSEYKYNGIDRVDNSKGYIIGNVVPCCKKCNNIKMAVTIDIARKMINFVDNT